MQRVIEFKKHGFFSNQVQVDLLNDKIFQLNKDGWVIKSITPNSNFLGKVMSYTLWVELPE